MSEDIRYIRSLERELEALRGVLKHQWRCRLDGKHGSQEVWECAKCKQEFYGNPYKCR